MSDFHPGSVRRFSLFAYVCVVYVDLVLLVEPCVERCHNVRSKIVALRYNCHSDHLLFVPSD